VCHAGGILELKKIGAIAEAYRMGMAPHSPQREVGTFGGRAQVKDGFAELPLGPGLGIDLDEKVAAQHPYRPVNRPNYVFSDGSVADH
jgi:galactonate dehydratase